MANAWVEHIKSWSKSHNVSYGCALSMPECKNAYNAKKPQNENISMMKEDKNVALPKIKLSNKIVMIKKKK